MVPARATEKIEDECARLKTEYEEYSKSGPLFSRHSCIPLDRKALFRELGDPDDTSLADAWTSNSINAYVKRLDVTKEKVIVSASTADGLVSRVTTSTYAFVFKL